jgi:sulfatase modifying factor 1
MAVDEMASSRLLWLTAFAVSCCIIYVAILVYTRMQPALQSEVISRDGAPMRLVPAGSFIMGADGGAANERPVHRVYLGAFYIDKFEVTTARYAAFMSANPRERPYKWNELDLSRDANRPVIGVNWYDAQAYCNWAGKRLPTEAEWEKAARGTDGRRYPWGNEEPTAAHGNFDHCCKWLGYVTLAPVGSFDAGKSPYDIHDLEGNVTEWTADTYSEDYYAHSPGANARHRADDSAARNRRI